MLEKDEASFFSDLSIGTDVIDRIRAATRIVITSGGPGSSSRYGQIMLEVAVNLCSRIFPNVQYDIPQGTMALFEPALPLANRLDIIRDNAREWPGELSTPSKTITLVVGQSDYPGDVYISASGWLASVGSCMTVLPECTDRNPVGAVVAACLGAAEVFKLAFGQYVPQSGSIPGVNLYSSPTVFSCYSYSTANPEDGLDTGPEVSELSISNAVQFGTGSVGSALLYTLSFLPELSGALTIVDKDTKLDVHNLLRYAFLTTHDLENYSKSTKVQWIHARMKGSCPSLMIHPFQGSVQEWLDTLAPDYKIDLAVSAVDSPGARRDIADILAKVTVNAGTGSTNFEVSRHGFGNERGCLYCKYIGQTPPDVSEAKDYVAMTGLPIPRVLRLLSDSVLTQQDLAKIAALGRIRQEDIPYWIGGQLRSLARDRLYSQVSLRAGGDTKVITLAFVSTMCGALLAGELIRNQLKIPQQLGYEFRVDLLKGFSLRLLPVSRHSSCLCRNQFRLRSYHLKYAETVLQD